MSAHVPLDVPYGPQQQDALTLLACSLGIVLGSAILRKGESFSKLHERVVTTPEHQKEWASQAVMLVILGTMTAALFIFGHRDAVQGPNWLGHLRLAVGLVAPIAVLLAAQARRRPEPEWQEASLIGALMALTAFSIFMYINVAALFGLPNTLYEAVWFLPLYLAVLAGLVWSIQSNWLGIPLALANAAMMVLLDWTIRLLQPCLEAFERYITSLNNP